MTQQQRYMFVTASGTNGKTVVGDKASDDRLMGYLEAYHSYDKGEWVSNLPPRRVLDKLYELGYRIQSVTEVASDFSLALAAEPAKRALVWTLLKIDDVDEMLSQLPVRRESRIPNPL